MINIYKSYIPVQYMYKSMEVKVLKKQIHFYLIQLNHAFMKLMQNVKPLNSFHSQRCLLRDYFFYLTYTRITTAHVDLICNKNSKANLKLILIINIIFSKMLYVHC